MEFLKVDRNKIVTESGRPIHLRGTSLAGWMNMEDFINGFTGSEHSLKYTAVQILGREKAEFLFDRMQHYFLSEEDIEFIKGTGLNTVRINLNYRQFEDDENPFSYKESGFKKLDELIDLCEKHRLYVILDLHAVQGFQNAHWHSDNGSRHSFFWHDKTYQDRFIALWEEFARRYRDRSVIAGYNIMNEPCVNTPHGDYPHTFYSNYQPDWERMNKIYRRAVDAIRKIDAKHIIFLEGDNYSKLFDGLEPPFAENLVYSSHNYNAAGFGPGPYPGVVEIKSSRIESGFYWDLETQKEVFYNHQGTKFAQEHNVPLWIGEFGSAYNGPKEEIPDRLRALDDQISVFEDFGAHWTTWTYKDVGVMGLVMLDPESEYMQRISSILDMKLKLNTDDWMIWLPDSKARVMLRELSRYMEEVIGDPDINHEHNVTALSQAVLTNYVGALIQPAYVKIFKDMSMEEIDKTMQSFAFSNCKVNHGLLEIFKKHSNNNQE